MKFTAVIGLIASTSAIRLNRPEGGERLCPAEEEERQTPGQAIAQELFTIYNTNNDTVLTVQEAVDGVSADVQAAFGNRSNFTQPELAAHIDEQFQEEYAYYEGEEEHRGPPANATLAQVLTKRRGGRSEGSDDEEESERRGPPSDDEEEGERRGPPSAEEIGAHVAAEIFAECDANADAELTREEALACATGPVDAAYEANGGAAFTEESLAAHIAAEVQAHIDARQEGAAEEGAAAALAQFRRL